MEIKRPASKIQQGNLTLFASSLRVKDLKVPDFFKIETLDSGLGVGYQRVLNEARAKAAIGISSRRPPREGGLLADIYFSRDR